MSFSVLYTRNFLKEAKRLAKKYKSLKIDIANLIESLEQDPTQGVSLGKSCYKIRMGITSKGKGKSGGSRVVTCVFIAETEVHLLTIYDKSDKEDISDKELKTLLDKVGF